MKARVVFAAAIMLFNAGLVFAGEIAHFVNLGFSKSGRYFMFAQYGVDEYTSHPYADLFVVDVPANKFAAGGVKGAVYETPAEPGYPGQGALFSLLGGNQDLKKKYALDHLKTGRILYLLVDGEKPKEELDFRDFMTGRRYQVKLTQHVYGEGKAVSSSFYIDLTVQQKSGSTHNYLVGLPSFKRKNVKSYRTRQVLLSPKGDALVFLIEKEELDKAGSNIRYMIETVRLD